MSFLYENEYEIQTRALQLLQKLGYTYLSPQEALDLRGGKTTTVLLEPVLRKQIEEINSVGTAVTKTSYLSPQNIERGLDALCKLPVEYEFSQRSEYIYELLTRGKNVEQSLDGDRKTFILKYIDWENPERNVYHVTDNYALSGVHSKRIYRPDIVLFVNGIPFGIIECKRPDSYRSVSLAKYQHQAYMQEEGIGSLYQYASLLMTLSGHQAFYATSDPSSDSWSYWREQFVSDTDQTAYNTTLSELVNSLPTEQDRCLFSLCRHDRLIDLIGNFVFYFGGTKTLARYHQYFAVKQIMSKIRVIEQGKREGGVIWQAPGSGKSFTMALLARAIMKDRGIVDPKIVLVTDRIELDRQLTETLEECGMYVENATTGRRLVDLLENKRDVLITSLIQKFELALKYVKHPFDDPNIFVLIDEGFGSQYGIMGLKMREILPNACLIGLTGIPQLKMEKNMIARFGGMIQSFYSMPQAVQDGVTTPLLYERRALFPGIYECDSRIYSIAKDISLHFQNNWQGTGFKGILVCANQSVAVRYKQYFDKIGQVTTALLLGTTTGNDLYDRSDPAGRFRKQIMDEYKTPKKYEEQLIRDYKQADTPEILIVVERLLAGFDSSPSVVIYIDRTLSPHSFMQAIGRVNRKHEGKEYGFVIDYYGHTEIMNNQCETPIDAESQDMEDLFIEVHQIIEELSQCYDDLWSLFRVYSGEPDLEVYSRQLRERELRQLFYIKLKAFFTHMEVALSSQIFYEKIDENRIRTYKDSLVFFLQLRSAVMKRYSDKCESVQQEKLIRKLIDTYLDGKKIEPLSELIDIADKVRFTGEIAVISGNVAKADTIASRTLKHINENKDVNPAFYNKFRTKLKDVISVYKEGQSSDITYLEQVDEIRNIILSHTDSETPSVLEENPLLKAYFGIIIEVCKVRFESIQIDLDGLVLDVATGLHSIICRNILENNRPIVDWPSKSSIIGKMKIEMEDFLIDDVKQKWNVALPFGDIDLIIDSCVEITKLRFKNG